MINEDSQYDNAFRFEGAFSFRRIHSTVLPSAAVHLGQSVPPFFCMPPCVILWSTRESYKIIFAHCTPERCWSSSVGPQPPQTPHDGLYLVQLNIDHCSVTMQTNGPSTSHWKHSPVNSKQALKPNTTHDSPSFCPKITPLVVLPSVHANLHRPLT